MLEWFKRHADGGKGYQTDINRALREYIAARVHQQGKPQKAIAADMDYAPTTLSRKLAQNLDDSQRFTLDDLERFIQVTGDATPVLYLVEKYLTEQDEEAALEKRLAEIRARKKR